MDAPCVLVGQWVSSKQTEWMDFCQPQKGSLFKSSLISLTARTPINRRQPSSRSNGCLLMGLPTEQFLQGMYLQDPPSEPLLGIQEKVSLACCSSNCIVLALDNNEGFLFCQWDAQGATLMQKKRLPPLPEWEGSPIHFMSLSTDTSSLAICFDSIIYVYLLETEQVIILQGHIGRVNQVLFLDSLNPEWVLSISDDRRFKGNYI